MLDANHVRVCLEPVNSTSDACDVRALVLYTLTNFRYTGGDTRARATEFRIFAVKVNFPA